MIVMAKTREMDRERNHSCCLAEQLGPRTIPSQCVASTKAVERARTHFLKRLAAKHCHPSSIYARRQGSVAGIRFSART